MRTNRILAIVAIALIVSAPLLVFADNSDAEYPLKITDGTGIEFTYTEPTEHIVTMGYAATLTAVELGEISKIIAVDKYSTYEYTKNETLKDLDPEKAKDMGSIYSASNNDYIVSTFAKWVNDGKMNLDDTIILTAYSNAKVLRDSLNDVGFTKVLVYLSITEYKQIINFVESMSYILKGEVTDSAKNMQHILDEVNNGLDGKTKDAKALYVRYSSGNFTVGNTGSIAVSLITSAGGINIAYDADISASAYGDATTVVNLVSENKDVVIFLDSGYFKTGTIADFRNDVLGGDQDIKVIEMKAVWNNYCPDSAEGLWTVASALYPDTFNGDVPYLGGGSSNNNVLIYAGVAAVILVIIVAAYFYLRK